MKEKKFNIKKNDVKNLEMKEHTGGESKSITSVPFNTKNCGLYVCHDILLFITPSLTQPMYSIRSPIAKFRLYNFIYENMNNAE